MDNQALRLARGRPSCTTVVRDRGKNLPVGAAKRVAALRGEGIKSYTPAFSPSQTASNWSRIGQSTACVDLRTARARQHEKRTFSRLRSPILRPRLGAPIFACSDRLPACVSASQSDLLLLLLRGATAGATHPNARSASDSWFGVLCVQP
jgi:hypothetical protein